MLTKHQRFLRRVNKNGPVCPKRGRCWVWTGPVMNGYGKAGSLGLTHRYSYSVHVGPIPNGLSVLHHCDNPLCVRPNHLFVGTQQDNLKDMRDKGRQVRGEEQGNAKITEDVVREIRKRYRRYSHEYGCGALAREFGIGTVQVWRIVKGRCWRHVDDTV